MGEDELDRRCVERCLHGDSDAFGDIVGRYQKPVYNAIRRMGADREEARDLSQQVFVKAFERLDTYDPTRRFFSWLYRVAINETINYLKARRSWDPLRDSFEDPHANAEEELETADRDRDLSRALRALDPKYRLVIIARHFLNLSYADAAHVLDLDQKTVKSRLFTARQQLRDILEGLHAR